MSLLLEALKRAERAKKQQNIEEITAALEDTGSTAPQPSAPTALSTSPPLSTAEPPAETLPKIDVTLASESFPTLLDEPESALPPLTTLGDDVSPTGHSNTLEFKLEPFDLPPVESPPAAMAEAPIAPDDLPNLDWSAVELSPAAAPTAPTSTTSIDEPAPLHIDITDSLDAPSPAIASASAANQPSPGSDTPAPTPAPAPALVTERLEPSLDASPTTPMVEEAQPAPVVIETPAPASPAPAVPPLAAPASPPPTSQRSKLEEAREKARRLLGKPAPATPEATPARKLTSRQQRLLILGAISTLSGTGIGLYFWNELNGGSGMAPMTAPALATNSATQTVEATNDGSAPLPPPVALPAEPPPAVTAAPLAAPALPASQATAPTPSSSETSTVVTGKSRAETAPVLTPAPQQPAPGTGSINIIRNPPRADVLDDAVKQGYGAYEQGNLPLARNAYQRALRNDPRNRQAMLGLAAIEEASGNIQGAATLYAQTLALDPKDTVAQAALVNLSAGNPQQAETKIRLLLAEQPNIAFLHFTLGNLLAAQQHWPEAETAYFQAVTLDGNNPDFAFNLAISLDQLRQAKPAREYYQRALTLSERRPYRFNRQVVQQRLEQLATP